MKQLAFIFTLLLAFLLVMPAVAESFGDQWIPGATGGLYYGSAIFNRSDGIYIVGGGTSAGTTTGAVKSIYKTTTGSNTVLVNNTAFDLGQAHMAYTLFDGKLWMMGGGNGETTWLQHNQTRYSTNGDTWTLVSNSSNWTARFMFPAVVYNNKMWISGGYNHTNTVYYNDTWWLDTANETTGIWTKAGSLAQWLPRSSHSMIVLDGKMWVIGGRNATTIFNDAWYTTDGISWTLGTRSDTYLQRYGAASGVYDGTAYLFGGSNVGSLTSVVKSTNGNTWEWANSSDGIQSTYGGMVPFTPLSGTYVGYEGLYVVNGLPADPRIAFTMPLPVASISPATASGTAPYHQEFLGLPSTYVSTWTWDFKDGTTVSTRNSSNTFSSAGVYNVSLTVLSPFGSMLTSSNVTVANIPSYANIRDVRFAVKTMWGAPIYGVNITAQGINTTVQEWAWLSALFGLPLEVAPVHNSTMICVTDRFGTCSFPMIPSIRYDMTFWNATLGVYENMSVYPKDEYYEIWLSTGGDWFPTGYNALDEINITVSAIRKNSTYGFINVTYKDDLAGTTGTTIYVNQTNKTGVDLPEITIKTYAITNSDFNTSFLVEASDDQYVVTFAIAHSTFGSIVRTFTVAFEKEVGIGLPSSWHIYIAVFFVLFTGMFFGAVTSPTVGALVTCFVGWIMWSIGWLEDMGYAAPTTLIFATFIAVLSIVMTRSRKERYL